MPEDFDDKLKWEAKWVKAAMAGNKNLPVRCNERLAQDGAVTSSAPANLDAHVDAKKPSRLSRKATFSSGLRSSVECIEISDSPVKRKPRTSSMADEQIKVKLELPEDAQPASVTMPHVSDLIEPEGDVADETESVFAAAKQLNAGDELEQELGNIDHGQHGEGICGSVLA